MYFCIFGQLIKYLCAKKFHHEFLFLRHKRGRTFSFNVRIIKKKILLQLVADQTASAVMRKTAAVHPPTDAEKQKERNHGTKIIKNRSLCII